MLIRNMQKGLWAFLGASAMILAACNGSSSSSSGTGTLNLAVSDTPVDSATSVMVTFTGVEIKQSEEGGQQGGMPEDNNGMQGDNDGNGNMGDDDHTGAPPPSTAAGAPSVGTTTAPSSATSTGDNDTDDQGLHTFTFPTPQTIDLLKQQGGNSASLLNGVTLPAGRYEWIRLKLATTNCCTITLTDGSVHPLTVAGDDDDGVSTDLKLVHGFVVAPGGTVNFTIDFNLRRSVVLENGQYFLKPVLRITDNVDTGRIRGLVANTFTIGSTAITDPSCKPAAYIFAGDNATPVDINPTSTVQPVATATVHLDEDTGMYAYMAGFLAPGDFTVALTCAAADNPQTADKLTFSATKNATVTSDTTTEVDFP